MWQKRFTADEKECIFYPFPTFTPHNIMGNLKKKRRLKMSKHKRRKRLKANRHKKRTWQK